MMTIEAKEMIRDHYNHKQGKKELEILLAKSGGKGSSLLSITGIDSKFKLKQMRKTWKFTRFWPMMIRMVETFFYIMISKTQTMIYFSMILSMYMNAGIISVVYPVSVFGYALLEETRPRKEFWNFIRVYTTVILLFKLLMNLSILEESLKSDTFKYYSNLL